MSDGHGPSPESPRGWASEQPPPYGAPAASPWTAPGNQQPPPHQSSPRQQYAPPPGAPGPGPMPPGYGYPPPTALRPGIIPLRPLRLGDIFDGTIKLVRSNPKTVLGLSAVAALLAVVPQAVAQASLFGSLGAVFSDPTLLQTGDAAATGGLVAGYGSVLSIVAALVSTAIGFVAVTLLTGMLTRVLGRAVFGGKVTAAEAWQATKGRIPALFGVAVLVGLIMLVPVVLLVVVVVAIFVGGGLGDSAEAVGGLMALLFVLSVLYVGYALFFWTRLALAPAVVVLEGRGPVDALRRSWSLVRGDFWRVLGILLLTGLVAGLVAAVLQIPFTIAATVFGMTGGGALGSVILAAVLSAIGGTLGSMLTYTFNAGVIGLLYADRRMRAEAFDLVLQTAAIEQQRQGWMHASADELWHPANSASR